MSLVMWLKIAAIGLPLLAALAIWLWSNTFPRARQRLAASVLAIVGLIAATLFVIDRDYACVLASGRQNCLFDGLATVSLACLSLVLARACLAAPDPTRANKVWDYRMLLLLASGWAGVGLGDNLLVFILAVYLLFYVLLRWMRRKGLRGGMFVVRDDYAAGRAPPEPSDDAPPQAAPRHTRL